MEEILGLALENLVANLTPFSDDGSIKDGVDEQTDNYSKSWHWV